MLTLTCAFDRYKLPWERIDVHARIISEIDGVKSTLRLWMYGFTSKDFVDAIVRAHKRGVDCQLVLDHTQSAGPTEHKLLLYMVAAGFPADRMTITTSPDHRQIMHQKVCLLDAGLTIEGSLNWSDSGEEQVNSVMCFRSPELTAAYLADFDQLRTWAIQTEPQYQHLAA